MSRIRPRRIPGIHHGRLRSDFGQTPVRLRSDFGQTSVRLRSNQCKFHATLQAKRAMQACLVSRSLDSTTMRKVNQPLIKHSRNLRTLSNHCPNPSNLHRDGPATCRGRRDRWDIGGRAQQSATNNRRMPNDCTELVCRCSWDHPRCQESRGKPGTLCVAADPIDVATHPGTAHGRVV